MLSSAVCVDFDGTMHEYHGWEGNPPRGRPIDGVRQALSDLKSVGFEVVCFTARESPHVTGWLSQNGLLNLIDRVTNVKPTNAIAFFDDRGYHVPTNSPNGLLEAVWTWIRMKGIKPPAPAAPPSQPQAVP